MSFHKEQRGGEIPDHKLLGTGAPELSDRQIGCLIEMRLFECYFWMPKTVTTLVQLGLAEESKKDGLSGYKLTEKGRKIADTHRLKTK